MRLPLLFAGVLVAASLVLPGCDPCRKLAKSPNIADKDSAAYCYYEHKQYEAAAQHFEELMQFYMNSARGEIMLFMYAQAKLRNGEMLTAAHFFQEFLRRYPNSSLVEEATYNIGYAFYLMSNEYELDQQYTHKSLEFFDLYKQVYPSTERTAKVEQMIREMKERLTLKAFKQAKLYLHLEHYKAAVVAFQQFLINHPDSPFREEATFCIFKAQYLYAENSITARQLERYQDAEKYYLRFVDRFPSGRFHSEAESLYKKTQKAIVRLQSGGTQATNRRSADDNRTQATP
jgi:outer membrane protein assembly factor BamD